MRVIGYGRQTEKRDGEDKATSLSLEGQETRYLAWVAAGGHDSLGFIRDHDVKGDDPGRPGVLTLLQRAADERADAVWVMTLSRFARDHILQELTWRSLQAKGVEHLVSSIETHTDDPFVRGIYGLMNQKALTELSAHLSSAAATRATRGHHLGHAPLGYRKTVELRYVTSSGEDRLRMSGPLQLDPETAPVARGIFDAYLDGGTIFGIASDLDRRGVPTPRERTWRRATIRSILRNPVYMGAVRHRGTVATYEGVHEPIVTRAEWERVQELMAERAIVRPRAESPSWCEGLVFHSCGSRMYRASGRITAPSSRYLLFGCARLYGVASARCGQPRPSLAISKVEEAVTACLKADLPRVLPIGRALERARADAGGDATARVLAAIDDREAAARRRHARVRERWLAGREPIDWMDGEDARLDTELAVIAGERAALPQVPVETDYREAAGLFASLADAFDYDPPPDALRSVLEAVGRVVVDEHGIRVVYRPRLAAFVPEPTVIVPTWRTKRVKI